MVKGDGKGQKRRDKRRGEGRWERVRQKGTEHKVSKEKGKDGKEKRGEKKREGKRKREGRRRQKENNTKANMEIRVIIQLELFHFCFNVGVSSSRPNYNVVMLTATFLQKKKKVKRV